MEHRCGTRHEVDIAVYARSHGGVVSSIGFLRDISASGGFMLTQLPFPLFAKISLRLVDAEGNFGPRLEGHVVRRAPEGVGVEWSDYVPDIIRTLGTAVSSEKESGRSEADDGVTSGEAAALPFPAPRLP